jgi:DNA-binding NarL/FixJ family response regulator
MTQPLTEPQAARVVVADDHPVYREGLAGLLGTTEDLRVVGQAATGRQAVALVTDLDPDLLVLDLDMPDLDGLGVLQHLADHQIGTPVLVLTMYGHDDAVFEAMKAGARGYLIKTAPPDRVLEAARAVARGDAVLSAELAQRLAAWFTTLQQRHGPLSHLTPREREVLALMVQGRDNTAIARVLGISPKTVRNVVSAIFTKLQVTDRSAAIATARGAGHR